MKVSLTNCTFWCTPSQYARECACLTRVRPRSPCSWFPPGPSPRACCTSSTPRPNRLLWVPMRTRKQTCPNLAAADTQTATDQASNPHGAAMSRAPGQELRAGPRGVPSRPYDRSRSWVGPPRILRRDPPCPGLLNTARCSRLSAPTLPPAHRTQVAALPGDHAAHRERAHPRTSPCDHLLPTDPLPWA